MEGIDSNSKSSSMVVSDQRKAFEGIRIENPFTFKAFQVFTGFGIGCGVGIGVGSPIDLGHLPMVGQIMSAARGATYAFSGVNRHVNDGLRKLGAKNIQAGIGCGVGFGHGIGVGFALKPRVVHQVQSLVVLAVTKLMMKFGMVPNSVISQGQGAFPVSLSNSLATMNEPSIQSPLGSIMPMAPKMPDQTFQNMLGTGNEQTLSTYEKFAIKSPVETSFGRTEKVISSFLQNPLLKEDDTKLNEMAGRLRSENSMLQMVLKHQQIIEDLMEENEKLRQILMEDLKIPPSKLQASYSSKSKSFKSPCLECFECRRKQRKR